MVVLTNNNKYDNMNLLLPFPLTHPGTCMIRGVETKVAFKEHQGLNSRGLRQSTASAFLKELQHEITLMKRLRAHPYIVEIMGVTFKNKKPVLVVELGLSTLDVYLFEKHREGKTINWTEKTLLCM